MQWLQLYALLLVYQIRILESKIVDLEIERTIYIYTIYNLIFLIKFLKYDCFPYHLDTSILFNNMT